MKAEHHRGRHQRRAKKVTDDAYRNPATRCWRCGCTLATMRPHTNGRPGKWTAGHLIDGHPDSPYAPECSPCNYTAGSRLGAERRSRQTVAHDW